MPLFISIYSWGFFKFKPNKYTFYLMYNVNENIIL